jgi:hypothetical protein
MSPKPCIVGIPGIPGIPDIPGIPAIPDARDEPLVAGLSSDAIRGAERLRAARLRGACVPDDAAAAFLAMLFSFRWCDEGMTQSLAG